jgi:hypothetical protein
MTTTLTILYTLLYLYKINAVFTAGITEPCTDQVVVITEIIQLYVFTVNTIQLHFRYLHYYELVISIRLDNGLNYIKTCGQSVYRTLYTRF